MWGEAGRRGRNWRVEETGLDLGRKERAERHRRLKEERTGALEERRLSGLAQRQEAAIAASAAVGKRA